jgi:hypothetical protein
VGGTIFASGKNGFCDESDGRLACEGRITIVVNDSDRMEMRTGLGTQGPRFLCSFNLFLAENLDHATLPVNSPRDFRRCTRASSPTRIFNELLINTTYNGME